MTMAGEAIKTRWILPVKDPFGQTQQMIVQVHDGHVYAQIDGVQVKRTPREVSELRQVLLEAQAAAFLQRGGLFDG